MLRKLSVMAVAVAAWIASPLALGASAAALLGEPLRDLQGNNVGKVEDLVIDARAGSVLYIIVRGAERFHTLPARALDEELRVDMSLDGAIARERPPDTERFRLAGRLLGSEIRRAEGGERIGPVWDIRFDPGSGRIDTVVVQTEGGKSTFPAGVLAYGYFPPLTRWPYDPPKYSTERNRLHDHVWK